MPADALHAPPAAVATLDDLLAELRLIREAATTTAAEFLGREDVAALLGIGASTFDRLRAAGEVGPKPVRLGGALRWHRAEVLAWCKTRDHAGELHGEGSWPAVWESIQRRVGVGR